jgi:hypothetical protein
MNGISSLRVVLLPSRYAPEFSPRLLRIAPDRVPCGLTECAAICPWFRLSGATPRWAYRDLLKELPIAITLISTVLLGWGSHDAASHQGGLCRLDRGGRARGFNTASRLAEDHSHRIEQVRR